MPRANCRAGVPREGARRRPGDQPLGRAAGAARRGAAHGARRATTTAEGAWGCSDSTPGARVRVRFVVPVNGPPELWSPQRAAPLPTRRHGPRSATTTAAGRPAAHRPALGPGARRAAAPQRARGATLRGASIQEDVLGRGAALTTEDIDAIGRRARRRCGADITRAHYALSERLLDRLDEAGILVWSQAPIYHRDALLKTAGSSAPRRWRPCAGRCSPTATTPRSSPTRSATSSRPSPTGARHRPVPRAPRGGDARPRPDAAAVGRPPQLSGDGPAARVRAVRPARRQRVLRLVPRQAAPARRRASATSSRSCAASGASIRARPSCSPSSAPRRPSRAPRHARAPTRSSAATCAASLGPSSRSASSAGRSTGRCGVRRQARCGTAASSAPPQPRQHPQQGPDHLRRAEEARVAGARRRFLRQPLYRE